MKEWKAVRQTHDPYQEIVIHGCDFNLTDSELFAALRRVFDFINTVYRRMLMLRMQVSAGKKILDCLKASDLLLSALLKSKLELLITVQRSSLTELWVS